MNEEYLSLLLLIGIIYFIYKKIKKKKDNNIDNNIQEDIIINPEQPKNQEENYNEHYIARNYILTKNELTIYDILMNIAKELELTLLSQVSLYSILKSRNDNDKYFNKIRSKSIDFVLIDKKTSKIEICIELDDSTHQQPERIERDNFINQLFNDLKIPLLRIKVKEQYNKIEIENELMKKIIKSR